MDKASSADKVLVNQPRKKWKRLNDIKVDYSAGFKQFFSNNIAPGTFQAFTDK